MTEYALVNASAGEALLWRTYMGGPRYINWYLQGSSEGPWYQIYGNTHNGYRPDGDVCLVGGDVFDGNIYLQKPEGRLNSWWQLVPFTDATTGSVLFHLIDRKHSKALVGTSGGNESSGPNPGLAHADPGNSAEALWGFLRKDNVPYG